MDAITEFNTKYNFMEKGGTMGELTRNYDWSATSIGTPDKWPQSLRLTLSMILSSKFPMFLWWGKDMIQFYNDAYRPSLGNEGKHPRALGQKAEECWPEIWDTIYPLIRQVQTTGESTWSEDQLIPIYRNNTLEDVYWTFGYSPIYNDDHQVEGVLVVCTETTEKVKGRRAVEESEQRFRTMAEDTDVLIAVSDEGGKVNYFNKAWTEITGKSMEELIEFGWTNLVHPDDKEQILGKYFYALEKKESWMGEFRILNKNGEYRWLYTRVPIRFTADGSFAGYISSAVDITERKYAEKKLQESEERVRIMLETAPFPIGVYIGRELKIELANKSILDIWGKGNVVGQYYREVLPELVNQEIFEQLEQVYDTGVAFHKNNQRVDLVVNKELKSYYFNYNFMPLFDNEGKVFAIMNTAADVTDLNLAKQKVEQSERNFKNMILQAPVAMCILMGPEHVVEIANEAIIEIWGKTANEVLHKPIFVGLPEAKNQGLEDLLNHVFNTGETFKANERPVSLPRDGKNEIVYLNFVYEPYRDALGNTVGILAIAIDSTEQVTARHSIEEVVKERTRELEIANKDLQKSNAELAQFAYIASHDLQEPLRKIRTFAQMLEKHAGPTFNDLSKKYMDKITSASARMHTLIKDVLHYSELVEKQEIYTRVNLDQIIQQLEGDFELLIEQKNATIQKENLPILEAIPLQMSQLFGNLLGNALKFSRKDVKPIIEIKASNTSKADAVKMGLMPNFQYVHIQFSDNGIGFDPRYQEHIFNIFQRLHRKADFEGTGIGLAMCKKIVDNHQGMINATGSNENGAVFNLYLPLRQNINPNNNP